MTKLETKLYKALEKASEHLDYCGYGDSWERSCVPKLPKIIESALNTYEKEKEHA